MKQQYYCFVAGHGGGHLLPTIAQAKRTIAEHPDAKILFFSTKASLDQKIMQSHQIMDMHVLLPIENMPRNLLRLPLFAGKFIASFIKSLYVLMRYRPVSIVSMGGYVTIPVCLAGWLLRIPIHLHELNVEPGKAISFLARFATTISIVYPETARLLTQYSCTVAEYPLRFYPQDREYPKEQACKLLNFSQERTTLFILGGSQGSLFFNEFMKQWLMNQPQEILQSLQVIHQTGDREAEDWKALYASYGVPSVVFTFHSDLVPMYTAADLVIARAGAGTLAELLFFKKRAFIIPLEIAANTHQIHNALSMERQHPALFTVIRQHEVATRLRHLVTESIHTSS